MLRETTQSPSGLPDSLGSLPEPDRAAILALSVLIDRIGKLPDPDRDDLFELLLEWRKADRPEQAKAIREAMEEILATPPCVEAKTLPLPERKPVPEKFQKWTDFISKKIRAEREAAGLTQQQLAEKAGLGQSHISRLENGEHSPSHLTLEKIACALGKSVAELDPCLD
jgi:DNA-binding XRE family transcriptional regulator